MRIIKHKFKWRMANMLEPVLRGVGSWYFEENTALERRVKYFLQGYNFYVLFYGLFTQTYHAYQVWDTNMARVLDNVNAIIIIGVALNKLIMFTIYRAEAKAIIKFGIDRFWMQKYDKDSEKFIISSDRKGFNILLMYLAGVIITTTLYVTRPIIENLMRSKAERVREHPYPYYFLPDTIFDTPYFEILFILQAIVTYQITQVTYSFDYCVVTFIVHADIQFKLLGRKIESSMDKIETLINEQYDCPATKLMKDLFFALKSHIKFHNELIHFIELLKKIFSVILLVELVMSSVLICLAGYRLLMYPQVFGILLCLSTLLTFFLEITTLIYICDNFANSNSDIGHCIYRSFWYGLPFSLCGRRIRYLVQILIIRSQKPCQFTAGEFVVITMQTLTNIMKSSMSYLTLLRTVNEK